jgi:peptidoglycan/LPS O-acetylase OafA/YrhL
VDEGDRRLELLTRLFGSISFGELAVSCFFLLSGYLIASSWPRRPELVDYFTKRIRRIYFKRASRGAAIGAYTRYLHQGPVTTYWHNPETKKPQLRERLRLHF